MVIYLFIFFFLIPFYLFSHALKPPQLYFAIGGSLLFAIGLIGQYVASGNEKIFDRFTIVTKLGMFTAIAGLTIKVYWILTQQEVYVSGGDHFIHLKGADAVFAGIVGVVVIIALIIYAVKYKEPTKGKNIK
jgi:hypothetical protein